jgi:hypothetical protein
VRPSFQQKNVLLPGFIIVPCAEAGGADSRLANIGIRVAAQPSVSIRRIRTEGSLSVLEVGRRTGGWRGTARQSHRFVG